MRPTSTTVPWPRESGCYQQPACPGGWPRHQAIVATSLVKSSSSLSFKTSSGIPSTSHITASRGSGTWIILLYAAKSYSCIWSRTCIPSACYITACRWLSAGGNYYSGSWVCDSDACERIV
ncbi:unnamed protein product [Urochloa humidicola]